MKIGIVVLATNAYFILGIRFIKKFMHHYKGDAVISFHFFSDKEPFQYLPDDTNNMNVYYHHTENKSWVDGTNMKFKSILDIINLGLIDHDYLYYFDADTNIKRDFTEEWFLGDIVGGQHYGDQTWMRVNKAYDRNPRSRAYIPRDTSLPQMYFYGAFFGGKTDEMKKFCETLKFWQYEDKLINYEPTVNDESYINAYFHYKPPTKVVMTQDFEFLISDKGGIGETRNVNLDINDKLIQILVLRNEVFDIVNNQIIHLS